MANTRDPKKLLTSQEEDILTKLNVEIGPVGMTFQRKLSSAETRTVARILIDLKNRDRPRGSRVNFALGDWMNTADAWFGKKTGMRWAQEEAQIKAYRDHLLMLTGATLIQLQNLENLITVCCSFLSLKKDGKKIKLAPSDILSSDKKRIKVTLGILKDALVETKAFDEEFEDRLKRLVRNRNRFIHHFWLDAFQELSVSHPPSIEGLRRIEQFISGLLKEATKLETPFLGLYYTIGRETKERSKMPHDLTSNLFVEWSQFEESYLSVLRQNKKEQK